ncbi:YceI family protein [Nonomuraea sp. KM88]|uniref:YceI family protein n=1 Tax=Nonomuraea sp. KM88 TaxID=3457427 RepID=UPI003FCD7C5F
MTTVALDKVPAGTWTIDPMHSTVGFSIRHLMGKVRGTFEEFTGSVTTAARPSDCSATATVAMSSVNTGVRMRDDDLRSANFFDIDRFPHMVFEGTGLTENDGLFEICGKLTIRGVTRDIAMGVEFLGFDETGLQGEQRIGFSAATTIRRSDFGVGAVGEGEKVVVGDKVTVLLDIQAVR